MVRAAVIYHVWPHYRQAVARAMDRSDKVEYSFFGSGETYEGIKHADPLKFLRFVKAPFKFRGKMMWQPMAVQAALSDEYDVLVYLGDPNFASTWVGASLARLRGKPVLMWAHGWLRVETPSKRRMRNVFFGLAQRLLVYGERAKVLGAKAGYADDRITVVYNSLDVDRADQIVACIEADALDTVKPQALFSDSGLPLIICSARITPLCRFDLLLRAAAALATRGTPVNTLLVGDGPARASLEAQAAELGVPVHFYGACYDEEVLGQLIYRADITVSPGKIGLTAMHSLMYGTPAITHNNLDEQMPEVEAIEEGTSGSLFKQNDADSLADSIATWLNSGRDRAEVRTACRAVIHQKWNPMNQAAIIEQAVIEVAGNA